MFQPDAEKADILDNVRWSSARPELSVLVPFLRDDPTPLVEALAHEARNLDDAVELILLDDGTRNDDLTQALKALIRRDVLPARLITLGANEGRSRGRNRLASAARADHFLFLDSDMRPDQDHFLGEWLRLARTGSAVAFGGFSLLQAPQDRRFAVHRAIAGKSECVAAAERARQPEKYVYTSNLLVRRDVFAAEAFDPGFSGWGWEDVEWAMRVSRRFHVDHIDNPATHMGLDTVQALAAKYEQSAPNFARLAARHPDIVSAYPSYRAARLLKRIPGVSILRRALKAAAVAPVLPTAMRALSLRVYRAALYTEAVQ